MTTITFRVEEGGRIGGFTCRGHSGQADAGADLVCAAVSNVVQMVEATVNDVLGLSAPVTVREEDAFVGLRLPGGLSEETEAACQALFAGMMVWADQLHAEWPRYVQVLAAEVP